MVKVSEVFSTSITLDEIALAQQEHVASIASVDPATAERLCRTPPVQMCHASSLLPLKHERDHQSFIPFSPLLCAFFAGSHEAAADTSIYVVKIGVDGCHSLVNKIECPMDGVDGHWNPVLFYLNQGRAVRERQNECPDDTAAVKDAIAKAEAAGNVGIKTSVGPLLNQLNNERMAQGGETLDEDNVIALTYKVGSSIATWKSYIALSCDDGDRFTKGRELVPGDDSGGRGPVRTKPFLVRKGPYAGRMIFPASVETTPWQAFTDYSDDDLRTIKRSNFLGLNEHDLTLADPVADPLSSSLTPQSLNGKGIIQPSLFEDLGVFHIGHSEHEPVNEHDVHKHKRLHMLLRSSANHVYRSDSEDCGETWSEPRPLALPNNNSPLDVVSYHNHLFYCGNVVTGNFTQRTPLSLFVSDDGENFAHLLTLEDDPYGEFSTPCVVVDRRHHLLYISYTDRRQAIKIRIFRLRPEDQ